ncbi:MAG: EamA family transporter [Candidatus Solibacter sp.]
MSRHPLFKPYLALVAVCFFWGTTYLGIRMALESFPPMLLVCIRYMISGSIMLGFARLRGLYLPKGRELMWACFTGLLTLGVGNGVLVASETMIPSGIAGLIITISPFWMVGVEALLPGGERLHAPTLVGMAIGLAGAALLFTPDAGAIDHGLVVGFILLQIGMAAWSFGSIIQRRHAGKAHSVVAGGVQQMTAGLVMIPVTLISGDFHIHWNTRGVSAIVYLIVFGSIVGYSAYVYVMDKLPVAVVSIYPYVNSVVAVGLGWLFYREPFGWRETAAMGIIFAGVAVVKSYSQKPSARVLPAARR